MLQPKRPDTPLAATPTPSQDANALSPYMQKRAAQDVIKQKNIAARDSMLNRQAASQGRTREEMRTQQVADKKKPDQPCGDLNISGANKRGATKGSCSTGETNKGESLKDTK